MGGIAAAIGTFVVANSGWIAAGAATVGATAATHQALEQRQQGKRASGSARAQRLQLDRTRIARSDARRTNVQRLIASQAAGRGAAGLNGSNLSIGLQALSDNQLTNQAERDNTFSQTAALRRKQSNFSRAGNNALVSGGFNATSSVVGGFSNMGKIEAKRQASL